MPVAAPCNICRGLEFKPGPNGRLALSGLPPQCSGCGSLEQQRIVRTVFAALPRPMLEGARCLILTAEPGVDPAWFVELVTPGQAAAPPVIDLPSSHCDWVYASQPLTGSEVERVALEEMLRVVGRGFVVLVDGTLAARYAAGAAADGAEQGSARGTKYADILRTLVPDAALLELVALDPCSLTLDSVFIVSRDARRLVEMASVAAQRNIHAHVFAPVSTPSRTGSLSFAEFAPPLPAEFDEAVYRSLHADLANFSAAALHEHYRKHGQSEGRRAHTLSDRHAFAKLLTQGLEVLEIAPFHEPLVTGPHVRYFDLNDKAGLLMRASALGYPTERVPHVHYASPSADLGIVKATFDAVISSHFVISRPDFVGHLREVRRLLRPGGRYFVLIPDRNYCFDHFMPPSTIAQLLDAHVNGRTRHTVRSQINYAAFRTHNDSARHWHGDHGQPAPTAANVAKAVDAHLKRGDAYDEVHAWYFDPVSFREIMALLRELGETDFTISRLYPTLTNNNEFWVVLEAEGGEK